MLDDQGEEAVSPMLLTNYARVLNSLQLNVEPFKVLNVVDAGDAEAAIPGYHRAGDDLVGLLRRVEL